MGCEMIDGVFLVTLKKIIQPKGNILHAMKRSDKGFTQFGEAYFTSVNFDEIKGWNKHQKMTLNLCVPTGKVLFVLYDDRKYSKTNGNLFINELSLDNYQRMTIPPGVWFSFKGMSNDTLNLILVISDIEHDPDEINRLDPFDPSIPYDWNALKR